MQNDVECSCEGWKNGADQIFAAQIRDTLATGVKYTGGVMKYCPWCGSLLTTRGADGANVCGMDGGEHEWGRTRCEKCHQPRRSR